MQPPFEPYLAQQSSGFMQAFAALPVAAQYGFFIVFGLVIGSFLTVVVHRLPIMLERAWRAETQAADTGADDEAKTGRYNLALPRSACPHCGHTLRAWENIPVISYVLLRGRCAQCGASVSPRYPLIELATAFFAAASLYAFGPDWLAVAAFGLCAVLIATGIIDFDTRYLPDTLTLPLLWAGLIVNLGDGGFVPLHDAVVGAIAGYLFLWCVYWILGWCAASKAWATATSSCSARSARGSAGWRCRKSCSCRRSGAHWSGSSRPGADACASRNRCRSARSSRSAAR
jgi:leader peptidase (prepilin peptidase) / N-methyltransferase